MRKFKPLRKAGQKHFNRWLFVLAILALILLSGLGGCDRRDDQQDEPKLAYHQQLEAFSARLGALEDAVQRQEGALQRQSTVLQQILDNVSPARMSPEWESRLSQLEDQVSHDSRWPKDTGEAGRFLEQVSELVARLPAQAEPHYLPRLSPVRWAAMAFVNLNHPTDTGQTSDRLDQLVDELRDLTDAKPAGGADALAHALGERATELAGEAAKRRVTAAVAQADRYVEGSPGTAADVARLYELLELYVAGHETGSIDVDVPALRTKLKKLYKEMLRRQAVKQAATLHDRWKTAQKLERHQPAVYEASTRMLLQQVVSARTALILEGVTASVHEELERELRRAARTLEIKAAERAEIRQAKALRSYQRWALSEIKNFEYALQRISNKVTEAKSWLDSVNPLRWDDPDYREHRDYTETGQYEEVQQAIIHHLLPIKLALLDLPVHEHYQQAFQTGWRKLDGRDDQTEVAKASALAEKKSLRAFLEDGS